MLATKRGSSTHSLVQIDKKGQFAATVGLTLNGASGITRAPDGGYLFAGSQAGNMAVAYYNSNLKPDSSIGTQGVVAIPVGGSGLRAVYTPDGSRTVVVGSMRGTNADGTAVEHLVVARILN